MVRYQSRPTGIYAYVVVSTDGRPGRLETDHSTTTDPSTNFILGPAGHSSHWEEFECRLPAGDVIVGFWYWTDGNTRGYGFKVDDIEITGQHSTAPKKTPAGACRSAGRSRRSPVGVRSAFYNHYYVAEFERSRQLLSPWPGTRHLQLWLPGNPMLASLRVEHFPTRKLLLIAPSKTAENDRLGATQGSLASAGSKARPDVMLHG